MPPILQFKRKASTRLLHDIEELTKHGKRMYIHHNYQPYRLLTEGCLAYSDHCLQIKRTFTTYSTTYLLP